MSHAQHIADIRRVTAEYTSKPNPAPREFCTYWTNTDTPQQRETPRELLHITGWAKATHTESIESAIDQYTAAHLSNDPILLVYSWSTYKRLKHYAKHRSLLLLFADIKTRKEEIAQLENAENMIAINPNNHYGRRAYNRRQSEEHAIRTAVIVTKTDHPPAEF